MKRLAVYLSSFLLATGLSPATLAGSQLSPTVRIVVFEAGATPNTLRLGVRKRLMQKIDLTLNTEVLSFNPATCTDLQFGFNGNSTGEQTDYFVIQLNAPGRSAEEQRRLLSTILSSFMTSRNVRLYVRDDLCSSTGGRVAAGISVVN